MLERRRERTRELGLELELQELPELRVELEVLRKLRMEVGSWAQAGCARVPS